MSDAHAGQGPPAPTVNVVLRRFEAPDETRVFDREMRAGDMFYIAPGHDSWVVGDEPYVSLHFMGGDEYARAKEASR